MPSDRPDDLLPSGLEIARLWAKLPPEHLKLALKARKEEQEQAHELRLAEAQLRLKEAQQRHALLMTGMVVGAIVAVGMLGAAVVLGLNGQQWLALALSGPSVAALAKIFVLHKSDSKDLQVLSRAQPTQPVPGEVGPP